MVARHCVPVVFVLYNIRPLEWPRLGPAQQRVAALLVRPFDRAKPLKFTPISPSAAWTHNGPIFDSYWIPFSTTTTSVPSGRSYLGNAEIRLLFRGEPCPIQTNRERHSGWARTRRTRYPARVTIVASGLGSSSPERSEHARDYLTDLRRLTDDLEFSDRVEWRHDVTYDDMWHLYETHDVFVSLAREDGGMAVLESLSRGTPVVVSDEIGTASYLLADGSQRPKGGAIVRGTIRARRRARSPSGSTYPMGWCGRGRKRRSSTGSTSCPPTQNRPSRGCWRRWRPAGDPVDAAMRGESAPIPSSPLPASPAADRRFSEKRCPQTRVAPSTSASSPTSRSQSHSGGSARVATRLTPVRDGVRSSRQWRLTAPSSGPTWRHRSRVTQVRAGPVVSAGRGRTRWARSSSNRPFLLSSRRPVRR